MLISLPDLGILIDNSPFFTVRQLTLGVSAPRNSSSGYDGTWGVWMKNGADVLVTRFSISAVFTQDFAVQVRLLCKSALVCRGRDCNCVIEDPVFSKGGGGRCEWGCSPADKMRSAWWQCLHQLKPYSRCAAVGHRHIRDRDCESRPNSSRPAARHLE